MDTLTDLEEIYLQQNQVAKFENLENNLKLETIDIAYNKVEKLENIDHLPLLESLWMNWNRLEDTEDNKNYLNKLKLKTIYLADNAMSIHDDYFDMLKTRIPTLRQIDGNVLRPGAKLYHQKTPGAVVSAIKQEMNP